MEKELVESLQSMIDTMRILFIDKELFHVGNVLGHEAYANSVVIPKAKKLIEAYNQKSNPAPITKDNAELIKAIADKMHDFVVYNVTNSKVYSLAHIEQWSREIKDILKESV